jgi:hypothetical protein
LSCRLRWRSAPSTPPRAAAHLPSHPPPHRGLHRPSSKACRPPPSPSCTSVCGASGWWRTRSTRWRTWSPLS